MNQNLFFEGPVRSGKSTALRRALLPHLPDLGGFVVQRLIDSDGSAVAYRLSELWDSEAFLSVDAPYTGRENGIFLQLPTRRFDPSVFETKGMELLNRCQDKKIILLDEIGGMELLVPCFRSALLHLLQGEIPCVGIVKEREKSREALPYNDLVRSMVTVVPVTGGTLAEIPVRLKTLSLFQNG